MDKKAVMKETFDGRVEILNKFNDAKSKLYNMNSNVLRDIRRSLEEDIETLKNGEPFWDGLTDARIAIEQEDYLMDESIVDKICALVDELEEYVESLTQ